MKPTETFKFLVSCAAMSLISAFRSYYFATDAVYEVYTLDSTILSSTTIVGDAMIVTQQCRRNCALNPSCQAFQLTVLREVPGISLFTCNHFEFNACNYPSTTIQTTQLTILPLWERLMSDLKPKPCVSYCVFITHGDCKVCRGFEGLSGLDCDIAPKLCSNYNTTDSDWTLRPIWPWGFYNRMLLAMCFNRQTLLISSLANDTGFQALYSLGWTTVYSTNSSKMFVNWEHTFNWPLISELQGLSENKSLTVEVDVGGSKYVCNYRGLEISSNGELTLNGSLESQACTGFPSSLNRAPFVFPASTAEGNCGAFWQFENTTSVCLQRTNLLNFTDIRWDGNSYTHPASMLLSFA